MAGKLPVLQEDSPYGDWVLALQHYEGLLDGIDGLSRIEHTVLVALREVVRTKMAGLLKEQ